MLKSFGEQPRLLYINYILIYIRLHDATSGNLSNNKYGISRQI